MGQCFLIRHGGGVGVNETLPDQITNFTAEATKTPSIKLTWKNPVNDWKGTLIVRKTGSQPTGVRDGEKVYDGTEASYIDTKVQYDTGYYYRAFPYNKRKQYQTLLTGAVVSATPKKLPLPAQVTEFTAVFALSGVSPTIKLSWKNPSENWLKTKIVKKTGSQPSNMEDGETVYTGTSASYTDTNVSFNTIYYYRAFPCNADEEYQTSEAGATVNAKPVRPLSGQVTDFSAKADTDSIVLSWRNPTDSWWIGTKIIRKQGSQPSSVTDGTVVYTGTSTSYTDRAVSKDVVYYYRAFPYNQDNAYQTSASGAVVNAMVLSEPKFHGTVESLGGKYIGKSCASINGYSIFYNGQKYTGNNYYSKQEAHAISGSTLSKKSLSTDNNISHAAATTVGDYAVFGGGSSDGYGSGKIVAYNSNLAMTANMYFTNGEYRGRPITAATIGKYGIFGGSFKSDGYQTPYVSSISDKLVVTDIDRLSVPRDFTCAVSNSKYVLFVGGKRPRVKPKESDTVDAYNSNCVRTTASITYGAYDMAGTTVNDHCLVGGGRRDLQGQYNQSFGRDQLYKFSPSLSRTTLYLSNKRYEGGAGTLNNYAVFYGGSVAGDSNNGFPATVADYFDKNFARSTKDVPAYGSQPYSCTAGSYLFFSPGSEEKIVAFKG